MESSQELDEITKLLDKYYKDYHLSSTFGVITNQPLFKANGTLTSGQIMEAPQLYSSEDRARKALISLAELQYEKDHPSEKPKVSTSKPKIKSK